MNNLETSSDSRRPWANVIITAMIVASLGCLVIPAIVAARASSRQMECANNIKVIAMAACSYSNAKERFPDGTIANDHLSPESRLSWYVGAWPYFEAGAELVVDREKAWDYPSNFNLCVRVQDYDDDGNELHQALVKYGGYPYFRCPDLEPAIKFGNLIQTAYVGPSGVGQESLVSTETHPTDGIWGYDRSTAIDQICDGLDNTVLLMETLVKNGPWTAGGPPTVREIEETDQPAFGIGRQFGGLHAGITNVAFADGSAKPLKDDIDMTVLVELVAVCDSKE